MVMVVKGKCTMNVGQATFVLSCNPLLPFYVAVGIADQTKKLSLVPPLSYRFSKYNNNKKKEK